jgi:hypothetical protein
MDIPYEKQFHFRDGVTAANLQQLKAKLETISYQEFYHHVNSEKNDFASWIKHVLHDDRLADDLQHVSSIVETVEIIEDRLHPRPVLASHSDMQSRIEDDTLHVRFSADTDEPTVVEEVPTVAPVLAPSHDPEPIDLSIIEETLGIKKPGIHPPSMQTVPSPKLVAEEKKVREELFGHEDAARAKLQTYSVSETSSEESGAAAVAKPVEQKKHSAFDESDMTRLIVKDFIYGLIFGLILGMIIGRIISM